MDGDGQKNTSSVKLKINRLVRISRSHLEGFINSFDTGSNSSSKTSVENQDREIERSTDNVEVVDGQIVSKDDCHSHQEFRGSVLAAEDQPRISEVTITAQTHQNAGIMSAQARGTESERFCGDGTAQFAKPTKKAPDSSCKGRDTVGRKINKLIHYGMSQIDEVLNTSNHGSSSSSQSTLVKTTKILTSSKGKNNIEEINMLDVLGSDFRPFPEFPTPHLLRQANKQYSELLKPPPVDKSNKLLPYPPFCSKRESFRLSDYKEIDEHAVKTPDSLLNNSLNDLVNHLCSIAPNDTAKVRVIFRWLTAQDMSALDVAKHKSANANTVVSRLIKLQKNTSEYSQLFVDMCKAAGLQAKKLTGLVRGIESAPGEVVPEASYGTWAAVAVDRQWRLFDPHWASRRTTGGGYGDWELIDDNGKGAKKLEASASAMTYELDETYFYTDPEQMIYSHFPREGEAWQMLARPVSKKEFDEMVVLKGTFFDLDLEIRNHKKCLIGAHDGEVEIELGLPLKRRRFMYRLWISTKQDISETVGDCKLSRFVFMQQLGQRLIVKVFFPQAGKYKLDLFCHGDGEEVSGSYICTYIILSDQAKEEIQPLPENSRQEWGPGVDMLLIGVHPISHKDAVIEAENGTAQVRFKAEKCIRLLHKFHSNSRTKEELAGYVLHEMVGQDIVVYVKVPERGEYALNLSAKEGTAEENYKVVCSYLVTSDQGAFDPDPYPEICNGQLGATAQGELLAIKCESHSTAFIEAPESGELEVVLSLPSVFKMVCHLYLRTGKEHIKMDQYLLVSQGENKSILQLHFADVGLYSLKVFGRPVDVDVDGNSLDCLYNFVVHASFPKEKCLPFPKAFSAFTTNKCNLKEPLAGILECESKVPVAVEIPNAFDVATISSKGWVHLEKEDAERWRGIATAGDAGTEMKLVAKFKEDGTSFDSLFHYDVKEKVDIITALEKQEEVKIKAKRMLEQEREGLRIRKQDKEKTMKELLRTTAKHEMTGMKKVLRHSEMKRYVTHLKEEVKEARELVKSLERIEELTQPIVDMDNDTMAGIWALARTPPVIHEVMVAALLLLGYHEGKTRDWQKCRTLCEEIGQLGLLQKVIDFKLQNLHPEIVARVHSLLCRLRLNQVTEQSEGAGIFYAWALGICEEARRLSADAVTAEPASTSRQTEILDDQE